MVPLVRLLDNNDVYLNTSNQYYDDNTINCNIRIEQELKMAKISRALSKAQRQKYIDLLKDNSDVLTCTYGDLKTYDPIVIQH